MITIPLAEDTSIDFKREVERKKPKSWLKSVSAFANGIGGKIVFGVDDNHLYTPLLDMQKDSEFISNMIRSKISPQPDFVLEQDILQNGNSILVLSVKGGLSTPYYVVESGTKTAYIRMGSSSTLADTNILHELILKGSNRTWDTLKSEYQQDSFSFSFFASMYYNRTGNHITPNDYYSFGLITKDGFLTNAGALFTDICPFRHSRIFCTRWNGLDKTTINNEATDDKEYSGNILQLLQNGQNFIKVHNQVRWYKTADSRIEKMEYVERAIFEALVNALVHRDYSILGSEIHIEMYDDRLEIVNPGGMYDGGFIQNQVLEHISSSRRNPVICDLMNRMDFMERRGSGFRKIINAIKAVPGINKNMMPNFSSTNSTFFSTFPNFLYKNEIESNSGPIESNSGPIESNSGPIESNSGPIESNGGPIESNGGPIESNGGPIESNGGPIESNGGPIESNGGPIESNGGPIESNGGPIELTNRQKEILALIKATPKISTRELTNKLGINRSAILKHINILQKKGVLVRKNRTRGNWIVKEETVDTNYTAELT